MLEDLERKYALTSDLLQININDIAKLQYQIEYINQYHIIVEAKLLMQKLLNYYWKSIMHIMEIVKSNYTKLYSNIIEKVTYNYYKNLIQAVTDKSIDLYDNRHAMYYDDNSGDVGSITKLINKYENTVKE